LELTTDQLRDAAFDTLPVRDRGFADLARQPIGPGRALPDGKGVLHLLVPRDDPHESRTIGLLLDQYRTDAGADPVQVQLHRYEIRPDSLTIRVTIGEPKPVAEVRAAHGYVTMRVDQTDGLSAFLAQTRQLSLLEVRGTEVWAGGWNWPDSPGATLGLADFAAIQRGYLDEEHPGFSLEAGPPETIDDLTEVLPDLSPELIERIWDDHWDGSAFPSADALLTEVDHVLFDGSGPEPGLPTNRTQLWTLYELLRGQPTYSQAYYYGRLAGTEVGMTLFYTDYVAKQWVNGIGTGVPTEAVGGFIPDPEADIPWSHCGPNDSADETGRLWFGQNESAFVFGADRISIGSQATRLFARSDARGDASAGTEVEPSYAFGRGLRWWDEHYQAVADYEPQYQRLEQIMRWSGALEWLVAKTSARIAQPDDSTIRSDLRFEQWYAQNDKLRERAPIDFVAPPSARDEAAKKASASDEAVLTQPSKPYSKCGATWVAGGVSLSDLIARRGEHSFHAGVPGEVSRAGLFDEGSTFDPATGTGHIKQVSVDETGTVVDSTERTFTVAGGRATVHVAGGGRRVVSFGELKVWQTETAPRTLDVELTADRGVVSQRVDFQGRELGELTARKDAKVVALQWRPGFIDRVRRALESVQTRLKSKPGSGIEPADDTVLFSFEDAARGVLFRVGGPDDPLLSITGSAPPPGGPPTAPPPDGPPPPDDGPVFRLGAPLPAGGGREFFGVFVDKPHQQGQWYEVTPMADGKPARLVAAAAPDEDKRITVTTPDEKTAGLYRDGDRLLVPAGDPVVGVYGSAEGAALLRSFGAVEAAMRAAAQAGDGLYRGVPLGPDAAALVGADKVVLAGNDHPWAERVLRAVGFDSSSLPLIRLSGDRALHVDPSGLTPAGPPKRMDLADALAINAIPYLNEHFRSTLALGDGPIVADALPHDLKVRVREMTATVGGGGGGVIGGYPPDIRSHDGADWQRIDDGGWIPVPAFGQATATVTSAAAVAGATTAAGPTTGNGTAAASGTVAVLLICPDTDESLPGCGE